jgi:hypothetical protein
MAKAGFTDDVEKQKIREFAVGFSDYQPKLDDVREKLRQSGGGDLKAEEKRTFHAAITLRRGDTGQSIQYYTYRAEASSEDYGITIHNFATSRTEYLDQADARIVPYLAIGANLIYMHREGYVEFRGAKQDKYNDWLWGLHGSVGVDLRVVGFMRVGHRLSYLWSKASTIGGIEYALGGWIQAFTISLYVR